MVTNFYWLASTLKYLGAKWLMEKKVISCPESIPIGTMHAKQHHSVTPRGTKTLGMRVSVTPACTVLCQFHGLT